MQQQHDKKKVQQGRDNDNRRNAKECILETGDTVLARQQNTTTKPFFDPNPFLVVDKKGSIITATRGSKKLVRDASRFKKISIRQQRTLRTPPVDDDDSDEYDSLLPHLIKKRAEADAMRLMLLLKEKTKIPIRMERYHTESKMISTVMTSKSTKTPTVTSATTTMSTSIAMSALIAKIAPTAASTTKAMSTQTATTTQYGIPRDNIVDQTT